MKHILLLLCLIGCGSSSGGEAFARDFIPVHLYLLRTGDALTACQVMEAWQYAKARYDRIGIRVEAVGLTELDHADLNNVELRNPRDQYSRLHEFIKYLNRSGGYKNWEAYYLFLPALDCDGMRCYGGVARNICGIAGGAIAIGQSGAWSSHNPPRDRIYASGIVAAHEIGHVLGAQHHSTADVGDSDDYPPNVMDLACGRFVDSVPGGLWFLDISRVEMYQCMGKAQTRSVKQCRRKFRGKPFKRRRCVQKVRRKAPSLRSSGAVDGGIYDLFE